MTTETRMASARIWPHACLPCLRLPLPLHRRRGGAVVSQPGRATRRGRAPGDLPDTAAMGRRGASPGRARARGDAAHAAVHTRPAAFAPAARLRSGRLAAPAQPRAELRRRPYRFVPVLSAARRERDAQAWRISDRRRLARDLDSAVLATLRRGHGGRARLARSARVPRRPPARLLLFAPARAASASSGPDRF